VLCTQQPVDLAGDVALQATHDLALGLPLGGAPCDVLLGWLMPRHPRHHDAVKRRVGLAITTTVESVAGHLARGRLYGRGTAEHREGGLGAQPARVVAGSDEKCTSRAGADAEGSNELRSCLGDDPVEVLVEASQLGFERLDSPSKSARPTWSRRSYRSGDPDGTEHRS
jgi:hypothetical protein